MDGGVGHIIATPMSDADIREYLPSAPILKYSELAKYPTLGDLLPEVKSFCILLYEDSPNKGHWVVVSRPVEGVAEYFDSYGGAPDQPLSWTPKDRRIQLGEGRPLLTQLFDKCPEEVVYNKVKYQKDGSDVNDCGRWCVLRTLKMKAGLNLNQFYKYVIEEDKKYPGDKDAFVSHLIP
jgi:hypothetical protein